MIVHVLKDSSSPTGALALSPRPLMLDTDLHLLPSFKYLFHICTGITRDPKSPNCQTVILVTYQKCVSVFPERNDKIKLYTLKKKPSFKWFSSGATTHGSSIFPKRLLFHLLLMLPLVLVNRMYIEYFFQLNNTTTFLSDEILKLVLYMPCLVVKHISSKYLLLITLF